MESPKTINAEELHTELEEWVTKVMATKALFDAPAGGNKGVIETFRMMLDVDIIIASAFATGPYLSQQD